MKYEAIVRRIITEQSNLTKAADEISIDSSLQSIGMDSISFIKVVVEIENNFGIEFPEEKLIMSEVDTLAAFCEILEQIVKE